MGYTSCICPEASREQICPKFGFGVAVANANFWAISQGRSNLWGGGRKSVVPIDEACRC